MKQTIVFLAFWLLLVGCAEESAPKQSPKPVATLVLKKTQNTDARVISGVIQPAETTTLTFDTTGTVETVYFDIGEAFDEGAPLAQLETIDHVLAVRERRGQLSEAQALLLEAERDFDRKALLVEEGAVSRATFDVSKAQYESAKNKVGIANVRLEMAQEALDDTTLRAPYSGTVSARYIEPAQKVQPSTAAFLIQGDKGLEVSLLVPESILSTLRIGQEANVKVPVIDRRFAASVKEIGSAAESVNAFPVTLAVLPNDTTALKSGMSAEVTFEKKKSASLEKGVVVPVSAIMGQENNRHSVFKVVLSEQSSSENPQYRLKKVPVQMLSLFDQHALVKGDLREGNRIVIAGVDFLNDEQKVSLINGATKRFNP